ncbi:MAG: Cytochrome c oxidase polypeptide [Acidobacteriales bacterium]|nr:Cytochrome c oxidase polypeptide [Terriglobales bacterium]
MATRTDPEVHDVGAHGHHAGDEGHHPRHLHHFDTMDQQKDASGLGMWVFLIQEVMFFGGLFCAYLVYRNRFFPAFGAASATLSIELGTFNTVVLIGSSLTMALAVNAAQRGLVKRLMGFIIATMILGTVFLGVKVVEYSQKFEKREIPGQNFCFEPQGGGRCAGVSEAQEKETIPDLLKRYMTGGLGHPPGEPSDSALAHGAASIPGETVTTPEGHSSGEEGPPPLPGGSERQRSMPGSEIYFSLYFAMTGMHALHMIIGMGLMLWLLYNAHKGMYSAAYYTPIENFGLYWHFVDIVWIYLFPLLYLINRHGGH